MKKIICLLFILYSFIYLSGCNNQPIINNEKEMTINPDIIGNIIDINCININDNEMIKFIIPIALNEECNYIKVLRLYGENIDTIDWKQDKSVLVCDIINGIFFYPITIEICRINCPITIKSVKIETDNGIIDVSFNDININTNSSESIYNLDLSEFGIPANIPIENGKGHTSISFVSKSSFIIDRISFSDFMNIDEITVNRKSVDPQDMNINIMEGQSTVIDFNVSLIDRKFQNKILYFNIILYYHTNDDLLKKLILPICTNISDDEYMKQIYRGFIKEYGE